MTETNPQGPYSNLSDRPKTNFAPSSYRGPQRRNPETVDATNLTEKLDDQVENFRHPRP